MNRDMLMWPDLMQDLDFLFTIVRMDGHIPPVWAMEPATLERICRFVCRGWVDDFDACDGHAVPTISDKGRELYAMLDSSVDRYWRKQKECETMSKFYYNSTAPSYAAFMRVYNADSKSGGEQEGECRISLDKALKILEAINAGTVAVDGVHSEEPYTREQAERALILLTSFYNHVAPDTEESASLVKKALDRQKEDCRCVSMAAYIGLNRKENEKKESGCACGSDCKCKKEPYTGIGAKAMNEAATIINGARNEEYGKPEDCFAAIAGAWSSMIDKPLTPRDVARMMVVLKCIRDSHQSKHDNMVDAIGYAAIASEME